MPVSKKNTEPPGFKPRDLSAVIDWMTTQRGKLNKSSYSPKPYCNASACLIFPDGTMAEMDGWQCHGFLTGCSGNNWKTGGLLLGTVIMPPIRCNVSTYGHALSDDAQGYDHDASLAFLNWLAHRSPVSEYIVQYVPEVGLVIDTQAPSNLLAMACILSRHHREKHAGVRGWHYLTTVLGVNEDVAYWLAFNCNLWGPVADQRPIMDQINPLANKIGGGHCVFYGNEPLSAVRAWCRHEPQRANDSYFKDIIYYGNRKGYGVSNAYTPVTSSSVVIKDFFSDIIKLAKDLNSGASTVKPQLRMPFGNYKEKPTAEAQIQSSDLIKYLKPIEELLRGSL